MFEWAIDMLECLKSALMGPKTLTTDRGSKLSLCMQGQPLVPGNRGENRLTSNCAIEMRLAWRWAKSGANRSQLEFPCLQGIYRENWKNLADFSEFDLEYSCGNSGLKAIFLLLLTGKLNRGTGKDIGRTGNISRGAGNRSLALFVTR